MLGGYDLLPNENAIQDFFILSCVLQKFVRSPRHRGRGQLDRESQRRLFNMDGNRRLLRHLLCSITAEEVLSSLSPLAPLLPPKFRTENISLLHRLTTETF